MSLEEENRKLKDEIECLKKELDQTKKDYEKTKKEFEDTKKEFEEYKCKHAHTVDELRRALKIKEDLKTKSKEVGAKKGHKAYARQIPARIDLIKVLSLEKCPRCNSKLGKKQETRSRYVTDIELTSVAKNTKYNINRYYCHKCKKLVEGEVPNVLPYAKYGMKIMLLVMYLRLGLRLPLDKIRNFFQDMYQLKISDGEIVFILKKLVIVFDKYYDWLEKFIALSRVKHTDTTSWKINGKRYNAWVFVAFGVVLYKIRKHNNTKTAVNIFGKSQKGKTLVIDRFSALRALAKAIGFEIQYCWAHILSDSKDLAKCFGKEGKYVHKELKRIYGLAISFDHEGTPEIVEQLKAEVMQLTERHYRHHTVRKFVNNLFYRDAQHLFLFVTDKDIASTNNISERELRHLVIFRKISNGSRTTSGAHTMAILLSVLESIRHCNQSVLIGLQNAINNPLPSQ
jgi:hypothetical protein